MSYKVKMKYRNGDITSIIVDEDKARSITEKEFKNKEIICISMKPFIEYDFEKKKEKLKKRFKKMIKYMQDTDSSSIYYKVHRILIDSIKELEDS